MSESSRLELISLRDLESISEAVAARAAPCAASSIC